VDNVAQIINPLGRKAALTRDPEELLAFWKSDKTQADVFPDALPWLHLGGSADTLPWAARHLD
jgi:hypothetical protein